MSRTGQTRSIVVPVEHIFAVIAVHVVHVAACITCNAIHSIRTFGVDISNLVLHSTVNAK